MRALLVVLAACASLPHVEPAPRYPDQAMRAAVRVAMTCSEIDPFDDLTTIDWADPRIATGVVISERHVLTVAHAVGGTLNPCPIIPTVHVRLSDGRVFKMAVERDDQAFGAGTDVARLVIASADHFHLGLAPPQLGPSTEILGIALPRGWSFGYHSGIARVSAGTIPGDSGAAVYSTCGNLVGLVTKGNMITTTFQPVGEYWLEGT